MKIKTKANLYIIIALTILMSVYIGYVVYVVYERTLARGINMAEQHAITLSIAVAERVNFLADQADILQRIISNYPDNVEERRGWVARQLETASRDRDEIDGIWVLFVSNKLDGRDTQFINDPENFGDEAGRVQIYAKDGQASFLGANYSDIEQNKDFLRVVNERQPRVVSRLYQSFDADVPIARTGFALMIPIIDPLDNALYGVLGIDIASNFLFAPFYEYEEPIDTQFHGVISSIDSTFLNHSISTSIGNQFSSNLNSDQRKELQWTFDHELVDPNAPPHTHNLIRQGLVEGKPKAISYSFISLIKLPGNDRWAAVYTVKKDDLMEGIIPFRRKSVMGIVLLLVLMAIGTSWLVSRVFGNLDKINTIIGNIASGGGDLTQRVSLTGQDEIAELASEFDTFASNLHATITDVQKNSTQLDRTSRTLQGEMAGVRGSLSNINQGIEQLVRNIEEHLTAMVAETNDTVSTVVKDVHYLDTMVATQSTGVTQSSAAIEEMVASITSVNMIAKDVADQYRQLRIAGEDGKEKQAIVRDRIRDVVKGSVNLQEANSIIEEIANQTNLLAMNAAIEAAHAGDVGKGFAVVADEIRNLAESAALQSKNISEELSAVHATIAGIESASDESESAYEDVFQGIEGLSKLISQIEEAMQEQSIGSQEVIKSLRMITQSAHDVKDVASKMKSAGESILVYSKLFSDKMSVDKNTIIYVNETIHKVTQTTSDLDTVVQKNSTINNSIWEMMKKFKV